jgi:hypothetical protein
VCVSVCVVCPLPPHCCATSHAQNIMSLTMQKQTNHTDSVIGTVPFIFQSFVF